MAGNLNYEELLKELGSSQFESLRPAQQSALKHYAEGHTQTADLAIELPTGAGKSVTGTWSTCRRGRPPPIE